MRYGMDNLALTNWDFGTLRLVMCNLSVEHPLAFGFGKPQGLAYPVVLRGGMPQPEEGARVLWPLGLPRVAPGKTLHLKVTIRFAKPDADWSDVAADAVQRFRAFHGPVHSWKDRRPIGMLMRSSSYKNHKSPTNPRGWLWNKRLDISKKEAFQAAMIQDARNGVKQLKAFDAQGMIFWDVEGSENPHPITYIGDPRLVKTLAPEMDEVADDYFKVFLDAGLRTGICIRPTQVYFDKRKKKYSHGTGSDGSRERGDHYPQLRPKDVPWWDFYPIVERICDKITYAKKRWGCTLYYIDTNGAFRGFGEHHKFTWLLLDAWMLKKIKEKHPDVLLIPELCRARGYHHAAYWAHAAAYQELDRHGYGTPGYIRKLFPKAFSVVNIADGKFKEHREQLKAAVKAGDILMSRGWFGDRRNREVKALYDEIKAEGP